MALRERFFACGETALTPWPALICSYDFNAACAAARRAIGTRNGEQDT